MDTKKLLMVAAMLGSLSSSGALAEIPAANDTPNLDKSCNCKCCDCEPCKPGETCDSKEAHQKEKALVKKHRDEMRKLRMERRKVKEEAKKEMHKQLGAIKEKQDTAQEAFKKEMQELKK